ncbi:vacuolar protein sorting-associated protein 27-like isoform X1 [Salvia divinorum]|uniref:Vacuolar protein sorting-associated protein 27-like isoform X1 n=1 Tax=Salvia divinorum TaxID=28513 RepID=A0ABD1FJ39_SALDI
MEPPPPPLSAAPPAAAAAAAPVVYADSVDSSPRSRHTDSWDTEAPPPQVPPPQKLRLMCSYGGHIVPRPHDKSLCYIGGDTRIIVIDRHTTLSGLRHRLSKTLLNNQLFSLKYQLPSEDLDSLISVTTDEDLENMVEEYDRLNNPAAVGGGMKPGRLRLFLFPQSSANIEQLLVETASTKSDDWFFNALNGKGSTLSVGASDRGFSESSSANCLLELDDESVGKAAAVGKEAEGQIEGAKVGGNATSGMNHDVHSVPDSPMQETTSSFGSTSSSPSLANLPPIRVHLDENQKIGAMGIEDQFQQMAMGVAANVNFSVTPPKTEEAGGFMAAGIAAGGVAAGVPVVVGGDPPNRVISDDERSDPGGYRRVQQIQPLVQSQMLPPQQQISQAQFQQKQSGGFELVSPDSVSSEGSIQNPLSRQRHPMYQEQITQMQSGNNMVAGNPADLKPGDQNANKTQMQQQVQESGYVIANQYDPNHPQMHHPQQFIHSGNQYIPAGAMPYAPYYSVYPPQQQPHHPHQQPVLDQQQFYFVPARQPQAYNIPVPQQGYSEMAPNPPSIRPQAPPAAAAAAATHVAYSQQVNAPSSKPEMAAGVYRTAAGAPQHMVQVPASQQHQPQYVGFTQIHHPSQMMAPSSASNPAYAYEFTDPTQAQMYYTQAMPHQFSAQYQTMTSAPQGISPDASSQTSSESIKQPQQVRTMQQ